MSRSAIVAEVLEFLGLLTGRDPEAPPVDVEGLLLELACAHAENGMLTQDVERLTAELDLERSRRVRATVPGYRAHGPCVPMNEHLVVLGRADRAERTVEDQKDHIERLVARLVQLGWLDDIDPPDPGLRISVSRDAHVAAGS